MIDGLPAFDPTAPGVMLPLWFTVPLAAASVLLIAHQDRAIRRADMPESRRRIRRAGGLLLILLPVLIAYALSVATPREPLGFVLSWSAVVGLLLLLVTVALADVVNTLRLLRAERRELRRELERLCVRARRVGGAD